MKRCKLFLSLILVLFYGCMTVPEARTGLALRTYHDPSFGWTASLPVDWSMCNVPGGQFVRDLPLKDPTRLIVWTYRDQRWLDLADGYAFMAGRFGQVAIVAPRQDMVIVFTSHLQDTVSDVGVTRWLAEKYILPVVDRNN